MDKRMKTIMLPGSISLCVMFLLNITAMAEKFEWLPPGATDDRLSSHNRGVRDIIFAPVYTKLPKKTNDFSKYTDKYVIDLEKYKISNNGENPVETSEGLNKALQYARESGANYILFPKGTYLISEAEPLIINHADTIIDLNGSTLQVNSNGNLRYALIKIVQGAKNLRITNGILKGDRETHDFKSVKGTHEWGHGVDLISGSELELDHLLITGFTGDGVSVKSSGADNRKELLSMIHHNIFPKHLEQGAFGLEGQKVESAEKMRSVKAFDVSKCGGQFELGYLAGVQGYPFIKGRVYQVYFYDSQMNFIKKLNTLQYRKVGVPVSAKFAHFEFNQPSISAEPAHFGASKNSWILRINNFKPPVDVHFHDNKLVSNRRLGMGICGGKRWIIEKNIFEKNKGAAPAFAIDFEDGWELMQDIIVRNNQFTDNGGDVVVCAGSQIVLENNDFSNTVSFGARVHNYFSQNNRFFGSSVIYSTRTGVAKIENNNYINSKLNIYFDTKGVADGFVKDKGERVSTPPLTLRNEKVYNSTVHGTYFDFNQSTISGSKFIVGKSTQYINFSKNQFKDVLIDYEKKGPSVKVIIEECKGNVNEEGSGIKRKNNLEFLINKGEEK